MDKRIGALIIFVIILVVAGAFALNYKSPVTTNNNTTLNVVSTNTSNKTVELKIVANQTGPETAKKGENVTINYSVSNQGSEIVYNVKAEDQNFVNTIGILKPGETKNYQYQLHIPTDDEVQEDFGANAAVSSPFFVGGFGVSFKDVNGSAHSINANSLEIKLV